MDERHDDNDSDSLPVTHQDLCNLISAITASQSQMESQLKVLKDEMLRDQEQVMEKAVKRARRECKYQFKSKGNREQYVFDDTVADKLESARHQLTSTQSAGSSVAVMEKGIQEIEEGLALIEERQKLIKLADRSDTGWLMVAEYQEDKFAKDSDDKKRIEKAEQSTETKLSKKRKRAGKGKAPWTAEKPCGGLSHQRSAASQWQLGQRTSTSA